MRPQGQADCGCQVAIDDDDNGVMHVHPCCPEHEPVLRRAAESIAAQLGMEVVVAR